MPGLFPVSKIKPNKKVTNTWEEVLKKTWYAISPPTQEAEIGRKWFVIVYKGTGAATLFIAKVNKWFLEDDNSKIDKVFMTCLKPNVGLGTVFEDIPKHLPSDQGMLNPCDQANYIIIQT